MCPHCHSPSCRCRPAQASLLPPAADWRAEMQQRVERYRSVRNLDARAPQPVPAPASKPRAEVLDFARPAPVPAAIPAIEAERPIAATTVMRTLASEVASLRPEEPVAGPVIEPRAPEVWTPLRLPEPEPSALPAQPREPAFARDENLADPLAVMRAERKARLGFPHARASTDPDGCIQIPLPMVAAPRPVLAEPDSYPVARQRLRWQAGLIDLWIVLGASLIAGALLWVALRFPAPTLHTLKPWLAALVGVPGLFTALYTAGSLATYGSTIGMRAAGLYVRGFNGSATPAMLRTRAWASLLSLAALGLGYLWMACDSHQLTWHDYISSSFVAERDTES